MALTRDLVAIGIETRRAELIGDTIADSLTATGATQATAYPIMASINRFTTVAVGTGGRLQTVDLTPQSQIFVKNAGANTLNVYPAVGEEIDGLGLNVPVGVLATTVGTFIKIGTGKWVFK